MFQLLVKNGTRVQKGQLLAYINGPFAQFQKKVKSPVSGYIICLNKTPVVQRGDAIFNIGQELEDPQMFMETGSEEEISSPS
jgi:predicted deacylase